MLREAKNNVVIEGILSETDIKLGSFIKNKGTSQERSVNSISGIIKIKVEQMIGGENVPLEVPVHVFATEITNKGTPNPSYQSILSVKDNFKSIAACGSEEEADRIRITNGKINMNEYWIDEKTLSSYPRINASFFTKVKKADCVQKATFEVEFVVAGKEYEVNALGEETGRYKIKGILPKYGGAVDVVPFFVVNEKAIDIMSQYWTEGDTVTAAGKLYFSSKTEKIVKELDFGDPIEQTKTINVSDLIITGGSQAPLEGDFAYDRSEVEKALVDRKAYLETKKEKDLKKTTIKTAPTVNASFSELGF